MAMKATLLSFLMLACFPAIALAQLSGPLSGTLPAGTYAVTGDISVAAGDSLFIEPGAVLRFDGSYYFMVLGYLHAAGAVNDSIRFVNGPDLDWGGIWLWGDDSCLEYCVVEGSSFRGLWCTTSSLISHCSIRNNTTSSGDGAGIYCSSMANATIEHCVIENNAASGRGGGIYIELSAPTIVDCVIRTNHSGGGGGGIYIDGWANETVVPTIADCEIIENSSDNHGAGIHSYRANVDIVRCTISYNSCVGMIGAAVYSHSVGAEPMTTSIDHCVIAGNAGLGAIWIEFDALAEISYCTLSDNIMIGSNGAAIGFFQTGPSSIVGTIIEGTEGHAVRRVSQVALTYCDFHGNSGGDLHPWGANLPGFGEVVDVNANGDPCDVFMNIFEPPEFVDPESDDYHLQASSACIDAGDPDSPLDPDDTTADIGALYYDQVVAVWDVPVNAPVLAVYPNPFNPQTTISFSLGIGGSAKVAVFDVTGHRVTTLADRAFANGEHSLLWRGCDVAGRAMPSGTYIVRLETESSVEARKVMLLR